MKGQARLLLGNFRFKGTTTGTQFVFPVRIRMKKTATIADGRLRIWCSRNGSFRNLDYSAPIGARSGPVATGRSGSAPQADQEPV
jgi:hypothetical protein